MAKQNKTPPTTPKKDPRANLRRGGFEKKQPTPQQKKDGRNKRKEAMKIMDQIMIYSDMTVGELETMIKTLGKSIKVRDRKIAKYLADDKFIIDWLNRYISYAPQEVNQSGDISINFGVPNKFIKKK